MIVKGTSATDIRGGSVTLLKIKVKKKKWCGGKQPAARPEAVTKRGRDFRCIQRCFCPLKTRPKKRKPEQKEMESAEESNQREAAAIQDKENYNGRWIRVQLHSAKPRQR